MMSYVTIVNADIFGCRPIPNLAAASHGPRRLMHPWSASSYSTITAQTLRMLELRWNLLENLRCNELEQIGITMLRQCRESSSTGQASATNNWPNRTLTALTHNL